MFLFVNTTSRYSLPDSYYLILRYTGFLTAVTQMYVEVSLN
jgi:hypothetical protein